MALIRCGTSGGGGGKDYFQHILGMGEYDATSSTQTIPTGTDYIIVVPAWIVYSALKVNSLMPFPTAYQGELYYLENVGDSVTMPICYDANGGVSNQTVVTWTSATQISISRQSASAGIFCFYFKNS